MIELKFDLGNLEKAREFADRAGAEVEIRPKSDYDQHGQLITMAFVVVQDDAELPSLGEVWYWQRSVPNR